ncbi:N-acetyltransferase domain-containing protein [Trichophyton interdigitale]|uniref:N-acetyltransferase domain-containing protein n=1 Tax=Trichophyton interdigitale TaxID=101480 RepID=A0A9P4YEJ9_9EURO|nr:N-acetyltransferase domain-containing protein [Trichophyton interdigitale]KAF3893419.1 N-acetyltransferase domain-containing protein [Trichophyton interdigitale]KAG8208051.1 N-acetyltransferase domain-containing protein [Trichophyton interdigitale]
MGSQGISRGESRRQTYTVRRIQPSDFPAAAEILANDSSLDKTLYPGKEFHHSDRIDGCIQSIRSRYLSPGWVIYIAVAVPCKDDTAGHKEIIVGYAAWKRTGTSPAAQAWSDNNEWNLNGISPDKPSLRLEESFPSAAFPELWYLATIAVDPAYDGEGIRPLLTRRGISHAIDERVPIGLESSAGDSRVYEKMGFRSLKTTMKGGFPVSVMVWRPPGPAPERVREFQRMDSAARFHTRCP